MILNASYYLLHTNKLCFCVLVSYRERAREREEIGWKEDSLPQKPYLTLTVPPPPSSSRVYVKYNHTTCYYAVSCMYSTYTHNNNYGRPLYVITYLPSYEVRSVMKWGQLASVWVLSQYRVWQLNNVHDNYALIDRYTVEPLYNGHVGTSEISP